MTGRRFLPLDLPEQFILEVQDGQGGWIDNGLCKAADFELAVYLPPYAPSDHRHCFSRPSPPSQCRG